MEVIRLSKKAIFDAILLVVTAGLIVAKAAYETGWLSEIEGWAG